MECNDVVMTLFPDLAHLHNPDVQVVKMCRVRWLEKAEYVWQPPRCLQWQRSRVHCSEFTHKNYMKTEILLGDICTVLEDIIENYWRSVLQVFNAIWRYLGFLQPMLIISSVSLVNVVEVKTTQYIHA